MNIKKIVLINLLHVFFLTSIFAAGNIQSFTFDYPEFQKSGDYVKIKYENCRNFGNTGEPSLPYYSADLLLDKGHRISEVKIVEVTYYNREQNFTVMPARKPLPLSQIKQGVQLAPDSAVYNSEARHPAEIIGKARTQFLGGHAIGAFTISPVAYFPSENRVRFIKSVKVEISTSPVSDKQVVSTSPNNRQDIIKRVQSIVDNPQKLAKYNYPKQVKSSDEVDLLLVSSNDYLSEFQEYVEYKTSTGFIVETIATSEIYEQYEGEDNAEKIRNCIIDYYQNHNLKYVILGGDADGSEDEEVVVPTRGLYATAGTESDDNIPADIYYSGLDGNWNDDDDEQWGEDGEEDMLAEVYVGRFSIDDATEVQHMVDKHIAYQNDPVEADIENALMVGELLWENPDTYGGDYKDEVAEGSSANGYTTEGLSDNFTITKLYQQDEDWSIQDIFDEFNESGVNILNHLGHANVTYNMTMDNEDVNTTNFTNTGESRGVAFEYSQGCYSGSFDNRNSYGSFGSADCFAEKFTTIETGAVATVQNSRYGWGAKGSTDGASQYFDREFFDAVFSEEMYSLGKANADSKEDNIGYMDEGVMRWCAFETNLLGDPSMKLWTQQPTSIQANYPAGVGMGSSEITFTTDAAYARIGLLQDNELIGRAVADSNGNATVQFFEPITSPNPVTVSITATNKQRHEGTIYIYSNSPYVYLDSVSVTDTAGNDNGLADYGEQISLSALLANVSDTYSANNVVDTLKTSDPYITLADSVEEYGTIGAEADSLIAEAFDLVVSDTVPDQHTANFEMHVAGDDPSNDTSYIWPSNFSITLNAPAVSIGEMTVVDTATGNGDGILDPGETANLHLQISNTGHADAEGIVGSLNASSEHLTLHTTADTAESFVTDSSATLVFNLSADSATDVGTPAQLSFSAEGLTNSYYSASADKELIIGEIPVHLISNEGTVTTCVAYFYDSGGPSGEYGNDEEYTMTFKPGAPGKVTKVDFLSFSVEEMYSEGCYDKLKIYDGMDTSAELIGSYCNNNPPEVITASNASGALTFQFISDGMVAQSGWKAEISCVQMNEVAFSVTDGSEPIQSAEVTLDGTTMTTDSAGAVSFIVENGTYEYSISKTGYHEVTGSFEVTSNTTENVAMNILRYDVTFNLYEEDGNTPIDGTVTLNGNTQSTADGSYTFTDVPYGLKKPFSASVSDDYYTTYSDSVNVTENKNLDITMPAKMYPVTITAKDTSGAGVKGCKVSIDNSTVITNGEGVAEMQLSRGTYNFTVSHTGYSTESGTIEIDGAEASYSANVEMTVESYDVTFNVYESDGATPVEAEVSLAGMDKEATDGTCTFSGVVYQGLRGYSVTAEEHVPEESQAHITSDTTLNVMLDSIEYQLKMAVQDAQGNAVFGADVKLAGKEKSSGIGGIVTFELHKGNYSYRLAKSGYGINTGELALQSDSTLNITMKMLYEVELQVMADSSETPISDAIIVVDEDTLYTDAEGYISTSMVEGSHSMVIEASGYQSFQDTLSVSEAGLHEFMLKAMQYALTFEVLDSSSTEAITNAMIFLENDTLYTDSEGRAEVALVNGSYSYQVEADDYQAASGEVAVEGTTEQVIELTPIASGINRLQNDVNIYPNPADKHLLIEHTGSKAIDYQILDVTGKILKEGLLRNSTNRLNVSSLHSGIYFIRIEQQNQIINYKLIIR